MTNPPKLFCKHCLVHKVEFPETNTTFLSILVQLVPMNRMHFFNSLVMSPLDIPNNRV